MNFKQYTGCVTAVFLMARVAMAGELMAIVNDSPISAFDVENRAQMILLQQGSDTKKVSAALKKQALSDLIDEQIKLNEAEKLHLLPSDTEVADAVAHLESVNGMAKGSFRNMLTERGIPFSTLTSQVKADMAWLRVLQQDKEKVSVDSAETKARKKLIRQELAEESFRLAELIVPTEAKAQALWEKAQNGADFRELIEAESIADSRVDGGLVSNAKRTRYGKQNATILDQMRVGQLSRPMKVSGGYALVLMIDRRDPVTTDTIEIWDVIQAILPKTSVSNQVVTGAFINNCSAFSEAVAGEAVPQSIQRGKVTPSQLPSEVFDLLSSAPFQQTVGPVETPDGFLYFMKCGQEKRSLVPDDETLKRQIEAEKNEVISRRKLSEIKRDAVIEYK